MNDLGCEDTLFKEGHTLCAEHDYLCLEGGAHGAGSRRAGPTVRMSMIGGAMVVQNLVCKLITRGKDLWRDKKNRRKRKIKQKEMNSRKGDWSKQGTQTKRNQPIDRSCPTVQFTGSAADLSLPCTFCVLSPGRGV